MGYPLHPGNEDKLDKFATNVADRLQDKKPQRDEAHPLESLSYAQQFLGGIGGSPINNLSSNTNQVSRGGGEAD